MLDFSINVLSLSEIAINRMCQDSQDNHVTTPQTEVISGIGTQLLRNASIQNLF